MSIVRSNIDLLVSEGLGERGQRDFILARDTCLALLKTVKAGKVSTYSLDQGPKIVLDKFLC